MRNISPSNRKTICRRLGVSNRGSLGYVQTSVPIVPFRLPFWVLFKVVRDFVVGVRGSVPVDRWSFHMTALDVGRGEQRRILNLATRECVEGSWLVLKAWRAESATHMGISAGARRGRAQSADA